MQRYQAQDMRIVELQAGFLYETDETVALIGEIS
jgi:hypothetical protein